MLNYLLILIGVFSLGSCVESQSYTPQNGDIVFQDSQSSQSRAIQLATKSPYCHVGIVYIRDGKPYVIEAVQPVSVAPLAGWIARGKDGHYVVKRLRDADTHLTQTNLLKMQGVGEGMLGKNYDSLFEWSDDKIYCSELVWKIYDQGAGIQLGEKSRLGDYDLSHPEVRDKLVERYGDNIPLESVMVPPSTIYDAQELETVYRN